MGGVIIKLTRGVGELTCVSRGHAAVLSWWGIWEACCSAVGVSVPKILSLDIQVSTVAMFLW